MTDSDSITVCAVAALANGRVIGKNGRIPWGKIDKDMKRFVQTTKGKPVIMGRLTFENILKKLERPLSKRTSIVITSNHNYQQKLRDKFDIDLSKRSDIRIAHSPHDGLNAAKESARQNEKSNVCVAGGGSVYQALLEKTDKLVLTLIDKDIAADGDDKLTWFPHYEDKFTVQEKVTFNDHSPTFEFVTLTR